MKKAMSPCGLSIVILMELFFDGDFRLWVVANNGDFSRKGVFRLFAFDFKVEAVFVCPNIGMQRFFVRLPSRELVDEFVRFWGFV